MSKDQNCNHDNCLKGKVASEYLKEENGLFSVAESCNSCLHELMAVEASLQVAKSGSSVFHNYEPYDNFQETIDLHKAEMVMDQTTFVPLPDYLKRYAEVSFSLKADEQADSVIVRLTKNGIRFVDSMIENMSFVPTVNFAPVMRSTATDSPESFIVLEEKTASGAKVTYQIIRESRDEAFLSIKVDTDNPDEDFQQANLRKEGRFIQSSRFNQDHTVSFSGLKDGKYNIELTAGKISKKIDFIILID